VEPKVEPIVEEKKVVAITPISEERTVIVTAEKKIECADDVARTEEAKDEAIKKIRADHDRKA